MRCEAQLRERHFLEAVHNGARSSEPAPGTTDNRKQKSPMAADMFTHGRVMLARPHNRNTLEANDGGPPRYPAATNVAKHGQVPIHAKNLRSLQLTAPQHHGSPGVECSNISCTCNCRFHAGAARSFGLLVEANTIAGTAKGKIISMK